MDSRVDQYLASNRIAIFGASRAGGKFGNRGLRHFAAHGYEVFPVHPEATELDGYACYRRLAEIPGGVDAAWICIPPERVPDVLRECSQAGVRKAWLQVGAESPAALALARELGIDVISGKCIFTVATPAKGVHGWQRAVRKLTGRL